MANAIFGFLEAPPNGTDPDSKVLQNLRWLGILILVSAVLSILQYVLSMAGMTVAAHGVGLGAIAGGMAVVGLVIGLAVNAAVLFWISWTMAQWRARNPSAPTHALVIGILATVFGALGVLGLLAALAILLAFSAPLAALFVLVSGVMAVAQLYLGIQIILNRNKAVAGPRPSGAM